MPNISEIQNQQFGVLKTNRLDMNGDIEMDRNGYASRMIKFNSSCNIYSSSTNNMHYRATVANTTLQTEAMVRQCG